MISGFVRRLGWWCWGLWVWVLVCPAQAQAPFCDRTIRVALFDFGVLYRADKGDGVDARLIDKLAARTGCTVEYLVLPRARIWQELEHGYRGSGLRRLYLPRSGANWGICCPTFTPATRR